MFENEMLNGTLRPKKVYRRMGKTAQTEDS